MQANLSTNMECRNIQTTEVKKTWEIPAVVEISKSEILAKVPGAFDGINS